MLGNEIRVVIADDNEDFCHVLIDFFRNCPRLQVVGVAHEGLGAVKLVRKTRADVLLLDMVMPNMDGLGVLDNLRQMDQDSRPKVIVFTAIGQDDMTRKAIDRGASYYIVKPFDLSILAQRMLDCAEPRRKDDLTVEVFMDAAREVAATVDKFRIPDNFKGYTYLCEAIMMVVADPTLITEVTKRLYPKIAEKHKTTRQRVERSMRFAIETAWNRGEIDLLQQFFGYVVDERKGKPTNASFIAKVADQVRLELLSRRVSAQNQ